MLRGGGFRLGRRRSSVRRSRGVRVGSVRDDARVELRRRGRSRSDGSSSVERRRSCSLARRRSPLIRRSRRRRRRSRVARLTLRELLLLLRRRRASTRFSGGRLLLGSEVGWRWWTRFPLSMLLLLLRRVLLVDLSVLNSVLRRPNGRFCRPKSWTSCSRILLLRQARSFRRWTRRRCRSVDVRVLTRVTRRRSLDRSDLGFLDLLDVRLGSSSSLLLLPFPSSLLSLLPSGLSLVDDAEVPEHEVGDEDLFVERPTRVGELDVTEPVDGSFDVDGVASEVGEGSGGG